MTSLAAVLGWCAVAATATAAGGAAWAMLRPPHRLEARLAPYIRQAQVRLGVPPDPGIETTYAATLRARIARPLYRSLARLSSRAGLPGLEPIFGTESEETLALRLAQAGMDMSPGEYRAHQLRMFALGSVVSLVAGAVLTASIVLTLVVGTAGTMIALVWLPEKVSNRVKHRRERIEDEVYPIFLRVSFHVRVPGASIRDAIRGTIARGEGVLIEEFTRMERMLAAGQEPRQVFMRAAERTPGSTAARAYRRLALGNRAGIPSSLLALARDARSQKTTRISESAVRRRLALMGLAVVIVLPAVFVVFMAPLDAAFFGSL
ncbi:MAG: type II secretion system F family protein [Acidimicrobiia bacterium]|nr:type II secretion system F family protein [Acidimicrobiia bacterium]